MRRVAPGHPRPGDRGVHGRRGPEESLAPRRTLSRITVVPVFMARPLGHASPEAEQLVRETAFLRAAPPMHARTLSERTVAGSNADVLLFDARNARPSVVYRAIVRARKAGWSRGIVLLLDAADLGIVSVASSIGASDFVLSSASAEEIEARLRRASADVAVDRDASRADHTGIELDWRMHQISFEGTAISLSLREMQLLSVLMERAGAVVTANDLCRDAWGKRRGMGGGLAAAYVCSLRKKLAWFGGRFGIQTVRAVGYRFVK